MYFQNLHLTKRFTRINIVIQIVIDFQAGNLKIFGKLEFFAWNRILDGKFGFIRRTLLRLMNFAYANKDGQRKLDSSLVNYRGNGNFRSQQAF